MTERKKVYLAYINSQHWADLRQLKFAEVGKTCQVCFRIDRTIHVHHINYRNLTDCAIGDLAVLCEACHDVLHEHLKQLGMEPHEADIYKIRNLVKTFQGNRNGKRKRKKTPKQNEEKLHRGGPKPSHQQKADLRKAVNRFYGYGYSTYKAVELMDALDDFLQSKGVIWKPKSNNSQIIKS